MNFFPQIPVEPEDYFRIYPEFLLPREQMQAWLTTRTGAVVGRKTANRFGWKIGDRIPIQATIWTKKDGGNAWEFDLVGIYDGAKQGTDTTQLFFRYDYFEENSAFGKGQVGWYIVRLKDPAQAEKVAQAIESEFMNSPAETKAESEGAFVSGFAKQLGDIGKIIASVLGAVFFTLLLVVGNTMSQAVRERVGEIGVLKAIGFSGEQIMVLILSESIFIAMVGGFAGLGIAALLISQGDPTGGALPMFFFPLRDVVLGCVFIILLGLVTGFMPAWQAMRLRTHESLRRL
jgi:putative ABC transport system permease protein